MSRQKITKVQLYIYSQSNTKMMCGGQSELNQPDDEAKQILESILTQLREKTGHADDGDFLFELLFG